MSLCEWRDGERSSLFSSHMISVTLTFVFFLPQTSRVVLIVISNMSNKLPELYALSAADFPAPVPPWWLPVTNYSFSGFLS